jgi:hypothetical protein
MERKMAQLESALAAEERAERDEDRSYWLPLRKELEKLRHRHGGGNSKLKKPV